MEADILKKELTPVGQQVKPFKMHPRPVKPVVPEATDQHAGISLSDVRVANEAAAERAAAEAIIQMAPIKTPSGADAVKVADRAAQVSAAETITQMAAGGAPATEADAEIAKYEYNSRQVRSRTVFKTFKSTA